MKTMSKNYKAIRTHDDLNRELVRLKVDYKLRAVMLKADSKTFIHQFSISSIIKKYATPSSFLKLDDNTHIISKVMSIALPMLLNATVFRGSGVITKAVGALVSGKLGKSLDAENISGVFNLVKSIFTGKKKKPKTGAFIDYGIPPDSETY